MQSGIVERTVDLKLEGLMSTPTSMYDYGMDKAIT